MLFFLRFRPSAGFKLSRSDRIGHSLDSALLQRRPTGTRTTGRRGSRCASRGSPRRGGVIETSGEQRWRARAHFPSRSLAASLSLQVRRRSRSRVRTSPATQTDRSPSGLDRGVPVAHQAAVTQRHQRGAARRNRPPCTVRNVERRRKPWTLCQHICTRCGRLRRACGFVETSIRASWQLFPKFIEIRLTLVCGGPYVRLRHRTSSD
jgi:hypothetical protein